MPEAAALLGVDATEPIAHLPALPRSVRIAPTTNVDQGDRLTIFLNPDLAF